MPTTASKRSDFYPKLLRLLLPIIVQNLISAAVNSADVFMLGSVGTAAVSAVSQVNQFTNILFMVYYGLGSGVTMLCAQYFGKGDMHAIDIVQGIALRVSLGLTILISCFTFFFPRTLMMIYTNDPELIALGANYVRIMSFTYLCWSIIEIYLSLLRSAGHATICMFLHMLALGLNICLNAVFIYGLFGAPKLGVTGVAIATFISRFIELVACFIVSFREKDIKLKLSSLFLHNKLLTADFFRLAIPALANDIIWGVAASMYAVILGHLSTDAVAAFAYVSVVRNLASVCCFGVSSATGVILGHTIGENRLDQAREEAKKLIWITVLTALIGGLLMLACMPIILHLGSLTDTARGYLKTMVWINSYYITGMAVNTTLIVGVFRSGGDSRFGMVTDIITMWVYALPLGFISAFVLKLPVMVVYFLICTDEFFKWPGVFIHYSKEKWLKNITRENIA